MAAAPKYKVYTDEGEYIGAFKHAADAAMLAGFRGDGATVRNGHAVRNIVWTEGKEEFSGNCHDAAAELIHQRECERSLVAKQKIARRIANG